MKKTLAFLFGVALAWSAVSAADHHVEPSLTFDGGSCSIWGYTNIVVGTKQEFMPAQWRARIACQYKGFTSLVEGDIAPVFHSKEALLHHPANFVTQAWVAYTWKEPMFENGMFSETTIRGGRFQTAAGKALPPLYATITASLPRGVLTTLYGTGVQVSTKIWDNLYFATDVTGGTGFPFNNPRSNFSYEGGIETSQVVKWTALQEGKREVLSISFMNRSGSFVQANGTYFKWSPMEDLDVYGGAFLRNLHYPGMKRAQSFGGYLLGDYKVTTFQDSVFHRPLDLRVHGLVDGVTGSPLNYVGVTAGIQLSLPKDSGYGRFEDSAIILDVTGAKWNIEGTEPVNDISAIMMVRVFF